ncbi:MAG: CBS domain-containing protein [Bacteroidota bacterium]
MKISASVYSNKNGELSSTIRELDAHRIDYFHIDCNDNPFVFDDIRKIKEISQTPIDLHIISKNPSKFFKLLKEVPVEMVTFQYEGLEEPLEIPSEIQSKIGLAITSETDISVFENYAEKCSFILFMATTPGKSGGTFNKENFRKIRLFRNRYPGKRIHVDGGVNGEVSFILRNMGVYASVSGSYLFNSNSIGFALLNLKTHENESHYTVKDFMMNQDEIPLLKPDKRSLKDVLKSVDDYKLGFTILTSETNVLEGIISNADIRKGLLANIDNLNKTDISSMTNRNPVTVSENATVQELVRLIKSKDFPVTYLPVVNDAKLVTGAVTFINLIKGEA